MKIAQILLPIAVDTPFDYEVPEQMNLEIGDFVMVPFRGRKIVGVVWQFLTNSQFETKIKPVAQHLLGYKLSPIHMQFIEKTAKYTLSPIGLVLKMMIGSWKDPSQQNFRKDLRPEEPDLSTIIDLNDEQGIAYESIKQSLLSQKFETHLLDGVTGSGKTQVFFKALQTALLMDNGKGIDLPDDNKPQILILVPEISLTIQVFERFSKIFKCTPLTWHSHLTPRLRSQTWAAIYDGSARVTIGARSALYLPYKNLKLIIVDEEHDQTYKQEDGILYQARDMAVLCAKLWNIPVVLVSATPALETWENVKTDKYKHLVLSKRYQQAKLPDIQLIDLKVEKLSFHEWLSEPLRLELEQNLNKQEQSILFLNRRGYSPLTLCMKCGYRFMCANCSTWLVSHHNGSKLICHHCAYTMPMPKECPECGSDHSFVHCGPGVERVNQEVHKLFPHARIGLLTSDECSTLKKIDETLKKISNREFDIVIGTQMLAKGHHFENMTLVGIVDGDLGLSGSDLRSSERCYQLMHQVSGRSGRAALAGKVLIQTYNPDHPLMQALQNQDRDGFFNLELEHRKLFGMPPYSRLIAIVIEGLDEEKVKKASQQIAQKLNQQFSKQVEILGPVVAPIAKIKSKHRWRILLKMSKNQTLNHAIKNYLESIARASNVKITLDVDPYNFM